MRLAMLTVLLLDDDSISATHTADDLTAEGLKVIKASPFSAVGAIKSAEKVDVAILDPGRNETGASQLIKDLSPVPVLIHAKHASLRTAVDLMKAGAKDYWAKPASIREMLPAIRRCAESKAAVDTTPQAVEAFVGKSKGMRVLMSRANKAAQASSTVLIIGETGTGKELVARHIHQSSKRTNKPLISVNCAAIPETLIESELFGYEKGAFTGANAQRVGLICATHRNLIELENTDAFRRDLFHRINVLRLELPPLRERGDDIQGLTNWLIRRVASRLEYAEKSLSDEARSALNAHDWPGNVRELEHTIERALVMSEGEEISLEDLSLPITSKRNSAMSAAGIQPVPVITPDTSHTPHEPGAEELSLEDYFQRFVLENQDAMNETELAQKLGISRKCLWERRQRFDLPRKRKRGAA